MGRGATKYKSNRRAILALALAYLLVLKALFSPFVANAADADAQFASLLVICSGHSADSGAPQSGSGIPGNHSCCDDNCCMMSMAGFVPPDLASSRIFWVPLQIGAKVTYDLAYESTGPPIRVAAHPQAQRAPPLS